MKQIAVYDDRLGYEKTAWVCPECGKITVMLCAPFICYWCKYVRPIGRDIKRPLGFAINRRRR